MDHDVLLDEIIAVQASISAQQGRLHDLVARLAGSHPVVEELLVHIGAEDTERTVRITDAVREELGCALRISPMTAHALIETARTLAGSLPATRAALATGAITLAHARIMAEAAQRLPEEARAAFERRVLPTACSSTPGRTRSRAARVVLALDPDGQERRRIAARCTRDVRLIDEEDGIACLLARLSTMQARAIMAAVEQHAPTSEGETAGERRAHALVGLVLGGGSVSVELQVTVELPTLLSLQASPARTEDGPVLLGELRALLADPEVGLTLRRMIVEPLTGRLLDRGSGTYQPSAALRRFIAARDRTCRFPGCSRAAGRCQVDHVQPWAEGGTTVRCNLQCLCTRHHQLKTHGGWRVTRRGSETIWTSPLGRVYRVRADDP